MSEPSDEIDAALSTLDGLATPADAPALAALRERISGRRLRVLIAGEAKRGKSTLLNRLLGRDVLPTGVTPVTAIATTVRRATESEGLPEYVEARFADGRCERRALDELAALVTERENPENRLGVSDVCVWLNSPLLSRYSLELVDTPGTGSVFAHNTAAAEQVYESLDAAVVVVTADPPISAAERDLLVRVDELAVRTFVVLNKADQLDAAELQEALEFTRTAAARALGRPVDVVPTSARRGLDDPGLAAFAETFERYLAERAEADLQMAARGHLARLAGSMLDAVVLTERGLDLAASSSADRVTLFAERVAAIAERRRDLTDRAWSVQRRVSRALDESGRERIAAAVTSVRGAAESVLDGELDGRPAEEFERDGRAAVVELIQEAVEGWRAEMTATLEAELDGICVKGVSELDAQLADLRAAAEELLGLQFSVATVASPLRSSRQFWYSFDRGVGWELPLQELAGRLLPGRRRRARQRILDEVGELVDRQVGRVRSDLAQRFKLSVGEVVKQLAAEHDEALGRVRYALAEVDRLSVVAGSERDERTGQLRERHATLQGLLDSLSAADRAQEREPAGPSIAR